MEKFSKEEIKNLRSFKIQIFDLFWEKFGTFYLHAIPHPNLEIGKRGLVGEEKETGIVLVFGPRAAKDIHSFEDRLYAELQFGYTWEKTTIPWDSVFRFYDKNQNSVVQMKAFVAEELEKENLEESNVSEAISVEDGNIIHVDFGGKTKK